MIRCTPDYYKSFRCLADRCPYSCCEGWEVMIDDKTAAFYQSVPGELGQRLRQALRRDGDEFCFPLAGGRCPFLEESGLCEIYRRLGEEHTSFICRSHPRFYEDYGQLREESLCASCPEVARMVLERDAAFQEEPWSGPHGSTPEFLSPLLPCRKRAISLVNSSNLSLSQSLCSLLLFSNDVQSLIDEGSEQLLPDLAQNWTAPSFPIVQPGHRQKVWESVRELLMGLEILGEDWKALLDAWPQHWKNGIPAPQASDASGRRIAVYFLFRHYLHAVWDGDVLSEAELCILSAAVIRALPVPCADGLRMFCREIEHCEENLEALQKAFCQRFRVGDFLALL